MPNIVGLGKIEDRRFVPPLSKWAGKTGYVVQCLAELSQPEADVESLRPWHLKS